MDEQVEREPEIIDKNKLYVSNLDPEVQSSQSLGLQQKDRERPQGNLLQVRNHHLH